MTKRILILDDDRDFTGLLKDIFRQSGYDIVPLHDPIEALERLRTEHFDLLVTDHRMPGMTGDMLVHELRLSHPSLPIIVISGFLDNDAIRSLIRDGVGGIFMKPLNVANLVRRTAMLLEEADERAGKAAHTAESEPESALPFSFSSFPCLSPVSREFALQLRAKADFKGALTLRCPMGMPLRAILADLDAFGVEHREPITLVPNRLITEENLLNHLSHAVASGRQAVFAFQNLDCATAEARALVVALGAKKGPFAGLASPPLLIFAFTHAVDELYERGRLDEALYLLASVTELRVPTLAECPDDVSIFANRFVREYCVANGISPELRLNKIARIWLREQPWPGNLDELRSRVLGAAHLPHAGLITRESFEASKTEHRWPGGPDGIDSLHDYLLRLRDDYIRAALILCESDTALAARTLGVTKAMLDTRTVSPSLRN